MKQFKLKIQMIKRGVTQDTLAIEIGKSRQIVSQFCNEHIRPTLDDQRRIATFLKCDKSELWGKDA